MLAKSRSEVELESVGALELKGLDEPVETYRVRWAPWRCATSGRRCRLGWRRRCRRTSWAGTASIEQLAAAWKAIDAEGERRVMLLSGEPGIGKTTLSARFACARCTRQGAAVVYGRCDEDLGIPYQPWIEALTQLVAHAPEPVLATHVAERGGASRPVWCPSWPGGWRSEAPTAGDADTERFVLFGCVVDLLGAGVGQESPVLVVLDDLHWADRPTRAAAAPRRRARRAAMRVGVLGTFRDSEITADHPLAELLAALHREKRGGADRAARARRRRPAGPVGARRRARDGRARASRCATRCWPRRPGTRSSWPRSCATSPRRARSTRMTTAAGSPTPTCGRSGCRSASARSSAAGSPGSAPTPNGSSALGAVIGRDFDMALLAAVAKIDEDTLIDLCDAAVEAAVLQSHRGSRPLHVRPRPHRAHPLRRRCLRRAGPGPTEPSPSSSRRSRGGDPGQRVGELAYHWAAAVQPTDTAKAVHYAAARGRPRPRPARARRGPPLVQRRRSSSSTATRRARPPSTSRAPHRARRRPEAVRRPRPPGDPARGRPHRRGGRGGGSPRPLGAHQQPGRVQRHRRGGPRAHRRDLPRPRAGNRPGRS